MYTVVKESVIDGCVSATISGTGGQSMTRERTRSRSWRRQCTSARTVGMRRLRSVTWISIGEVAVRERRERKREKRKKGKEEKRLMKPARRCIRQEEIERRQRQLMISLRLLWLLRREGVRRHRCGEMFLNLLDFYCFV